MKILGIIPARYQSSRFPGKALADIKGKTMIWRVYEQAQKANSLNHLVVATDHEEIYNHITDQGGKAVMTRSDHKNGTERCAEVLENASEEIDFVINIQGDEPFINPSQIDELADLLNNNTQIATLVKQITTYDELFNRNVNKAIVDKTGNAIYFSRSPLPFLRDVPEDQWLDRHVFYKHIGIYAYQSEILKEIIKLEPTTLEQAEALEQLRWIQHGYPIKTGITTYESIGIDTPEDLERALSYYSGQ